MDSGRGKLLQKKPSNKKIFKTYSDSPQPIVFFVQNHENLTLGFDILENRPK